MENIKVKLFAIAKDEAAYIPQWVFHHFYFGFDEIEIWLNNIEDNSVEICEKIATIFPQFKYKVVDDLLFECKEKNIHFQEQAYNISYQQARDSGFSHILYIDIDEFWVHKSFELTIKDYLDNFTVADTISFNWAFDNALISNQLFHQVFNQSQLVFKNNHVKSLVRMSQKVIKTHIHNHHIKNGLQILANGEKLCIDSNTFEGSIVPDYQFIKYQHELDDAFIYHTLFRSQIEYLSSLLRGRRHTTTKELIKLNRWGYVNQSDGINFHIQEVLINLYNKKYIDFLIDSELLLNVIKGQKFIIDRFNKVKSFIANEKTNDDITRVLHGITINGIAQKEYKTKFHIDQLLLSENAELFLSGWLVDDGYDNDIIIKFKNLQNNEELRGTIKRINRPDVIQQVSQRAPLNCGFEFKAINFSGGCIPISVELLSFDYESGVVTLGIGA